MKKIPTLFKREYENHKVVGITPELSSPDLQWVLDGEGDATVKFDGSCCAIIDGEFYRRYDAKKNKKGEYKAPPEGAIPCCDPDPITGHWPHWVKVTGYSEDKWYYLAYLRDLEHYGCLEDGTYEAIGPHFQGNPYNLSFDHLVRHGIEIVTVERTFDGIRKFLEEAQIEGLVFWKDGEPRCKIKRSDFGFEWPCKKENNDD